MLNLKYDSTYRKRKRASQEKFNNLSERRRSLTFSQATSVMTSFSRGADPSNDFLTFAAPWSQLDFLTFHENEEIK